LAEQRSHEEDLINEAVSPFAPRALVVETGSLSEAERSAIIESHRFSTHVMHMRVEEERAYLKFARIREELELTPIRPSTVSSTQSGHSSMRSDWDDTHTSFACYSQSIKTHEHGKYGKDLEGDGHDGGEQPFFSPNDGDVALDKGGTQERSVIIV